MRYDWYTRSSVRRTLDLRRITVSCRFQACKVRCHEASLTLFFSSELSIYAGPKGSFCCVPRPSVRFTMYRSVVSVFCRVLSLRVRWIDAVFLFCVTSERPMFVVPMRACCSVPRPSVRCFLDQSGRFCSLPRTIVLYVMYRRGLC